MKTATFWDRAAAWGYDFLGFQFLFLFISQIVKPDGLFAVLFFTLFYLMSYMTYHAVMESLYGASLGKYLIGIGVVRDALPGQNKQSAKSSRMIDDKETHLSLSESFIRQFASCMSWITLNIGHALALFRPDKKMLHDLVTSTSVVKKDLDIPHLPYLLPEHHQKYKIISFILQGCVMLISMVWMVWTITTLLEVARTQAIGV